VRWRPDHLYMSETPASARLRRAVRAIILADDDRVLLCRFGFPHRAVPAGATVVWAAPGGGIEPGELPLAAQRRELHEETGIVIDADPTHVRHQEVAVGTGLFSPRDIATPLAALIAGDIPDTPVMLEGRRDERRESGSDRPVRCLRDTNRRHEAGRAYRRLGRVVRLRFVTGSDAAERQVRRGPCGDSPASRGLFSCGAGRRVVASGPGRGCDVRHWLGLAWRAEAGIMRP
jgi:8-oxo-dGTP diphosphatase